MNGTLKGHFVVARFTANKPLITSEAFMPFAQDASIIVDIYCSGSGWVRVLSMSNIE